MTTSKLTETQVVILTLASQRPDRRVLPLPPDVPKKGGTSTRALKAMLQRQLIGEVIASADDQEWSRNADGGRLTLVIVEAGFDALGLAEPSPPSTTAMQGTVDAPTPSVTDANPPANGSSLIGAELRPGTKGAAIVTLLRRDQGATVPDLMSASGWQAHSVRGFLSGTLRKKRNLNIASDPAEGGRRYRIVS